MSEEQSPKIGEGLKLTIPAFGKSSAISLDLSKTKEAESRLIESKTVNPITYVDLEYCFNEAYRELKRHYSTLGYEKDLAAKAMDMAKADFIIDVYPDIIKDMPKSWDNADRRNSYLTRDEAYQAALDRFNMLKAMESFVDGRIKVMERTCAYLKKQVDLIIRSGLSDRGLYITGNKK